MSEPPLYTAAHNGKLDEVKQLIACGYDINQMSKNGWTPLMTAAYWGYAGVVNFLLEKGAGFTDVSSSGLSALELAVKTGHGEIICALLAKGADRFLGDSTVHELLQSCAARLKVSENSLRAKEGEIKKQMARVEELTTMLKTRELEINIYKTQLENANKKVLTLQERVIASDNYIRELETKRVLTEGLFCAASDKPAWTDAQENDFSELATRSDEDAAKVDVTNAPPIEQLQTAPRGEGNAVDETENQVINCHPETDVCMHTEQCANANAHVKELESKQKNTERVINVLTLPLVV